jgi:hypothetical protein
MTTWGQTKGAVQMGYRATSLLYRWTFTGEGSRRRSPTVVKVGNRQKDTTFSTNKNGGQRMNEGRRVEKVILLNRFLSSV